MRATPFEYRFRYAIHGLLYLLGFWAPWTLYTDTFGTRRTLWEAGMPALQSTHLFTFTNAAYALLIVAILLAFAGAALRFWGTAYVGSGVVKSPGMHGQALLADGPYRRTRNPLYLGTFLHTLALALLMPVSGAVFAVVLLGVLQVRLALAEEPFLTARFGEAYTAYAGRVPRFLPSITPSVPAAGQQPHWLQALLGEIYVVGVAICFAALGWSFNSQLLIKAVLVCLGVSIVARAFVPRPVVQPG